MVGLLVEQIAKLAVGFCFARTENPVDVEYLLRVGETKADVAVV